MSKGRRMTRVKESLALAKGRLAVHGDDHTTCGTCILCHALIDAHAEIGRLRRALRDARKAKR